MICANCCSFHLPHSWVIECFHILISLTKWNALSQPLVISTFFFFWQISILSNRIPVCSLWQFLCLAAGPETRGSGERGWLAWRICFHLADTSGMYTGCYWAFVIVQDAPSCGSNNCNNYNNCNINNNSSDAVRSRGCCRFQSSAVAAAWL